MKRNDFATFLTYLLMVGLAVLIGLVWIRPAVEENSAYLAIPGIVLVILGMVGGILLNASLLELGHRLGAKTGKYRVRSFVILGLGYKMKEGKKKWGFNSFTGLTGETKIAPIDPEKSRLTGYILFPIFFYFIEILISAIMIGLGNSYRADGMGWMSIIGITLIGIAGMILIYDYFPARLDEVNDGYLMMVTSKNVNKIAYNNILLEEEAKEEGKPAPAVRVYEEVTDFTYAINKIAVYRAIEQNNIKMAIQILDMAIATESGLSKANIEHARCLKLTLLLGDRNTFNKGKEMYETFEDNTKSYISELSSIVSVRSYVLISSFLESSENECNYAIEKANKALKAEDEAVREVEKKLLEANVAMVRDMHPGWDVSKLPWEDIEEVEKTEESK